MDIAIDFDGTCVYHDFPKIGGDIGAVPVLQRLVAQGHNLILFTMRSNCEGNSKMSREFPEVINGNFLDDAVNWFKENNIPLYGIQSNPEQNGWTTSPKCYAQLYIDDAALGCPLIPYEYDEGPNGEPINARPFVDWEKVEELLIEKGILTAHTRSSPETEHPASS